MRIYSMTATFGKLSHESLQFTEGLNIIEAPNEWGKSTWCAFLTAMLYGIDTRQQTTKSFLADKERYMPWSGEPMSGCIELSWNDRCITIERSTKGRIPFGEFRAYETATGLNVPELTATNCGQQLLGVEKAVFTRAGFIRLQDMPVTPDDNLRRRLNSLVTTGDESGTGDTLGKQLKDLKNRIRYNRSGLLPQAEYEQEKLRGQMERQQELQAQIAQITARQAQLEQEIRELENHGDALRYQAAKQGADRLRAADAACRQVQAEFDSLETACHQLPSEEAAQASLLAGKDLLMRQKEFLTRQQTLPPKPVAPEVPALYREVTTEQACAYAEADFQKQQNLSRRVKKLALLPALLGIGALVLITGLILLCSFGGMEPLVMYITGAMILAACCVGIALTVASITGSNRALAELAQKYPGISPQEWTLHAKNYQASQSAYQLAMAQYQQACGDFALQQAQLEQAILSYTAGKALEQTVEDWETILQSHRQLGVKGRELKNASEHVLALQAVVTDAPPPASDDFLTYSAQETEDKLNHCRFEQRQLQIKLGQAMGQSEALGPEGALKARLDSITRRIARLEQHYRALELAQEVLYQATSALQRRFAPRINKRAQDYFARLTGGRYQRLSLSDDFTLGTSAENEDILRSSQWRSDGTADQLYLSLRLAVAGELTPHSPLVLDDALLRFDDTRLQAALEVLQEEAQQKQVILFTCQSREKNCYK